LALVITADHGMTFRKTESDRYVGGHASDAYADAVESQRIPLIISGPNIRIDVINGTYGQEDIAPTMLSILDVVEVLSHSDGDVIPVKRHANLRVIAGSPAEITLQRDDVTLHSITAKDVTFIGLIPGNYTILSGKYVDSIDLRSDKVIEIKASPHDRMVLAVVMMSMIAVGGGLMIRRIMKEN